MTDRELLEAAARAAGLKHLEWFPLKTGGTMAHIHRDDSGRREERWNPLADDGDALRLAVKLNLKAVFHPALNQAIVRPYYASDDAWLENGEDHPDPYTATRRAIVRAAAAMPPQAVAGTDAGEGK